MEKVRFEAFNVEELRVLRRACYEAGAAFGDPGHTAAERATLDDLSVEILGELKKKEAAAAQQRQEEPLEKAAKEPEKGAADRPPVAPKAFQKPEPQKKRAVQRLDILERAKATQPAESAHRAPEPPVEARFTSFLYVRCEKCGQERGFCAKTPISSCYCRECGGNYGLQLNRPPQSWCYVVGPGECHKELQEQVKATLNRIYPRKKVSDILPKPEILGQLAEELAEASAAASKLRRKIDGKNPTPKTLEECWEDLKKEIGDVMNSIDALTGQDPQNYHEFMSECGEYAEPKMERWLCRLNEQKEEHA